MNGTPHSELLDTLVENRLAMNFIVFAEVGIGSRWLQHGNLPVPDVMTLRYSYTQPDVTIYEVKAIRRDFLQDVNEAKYRRYLPFCDRFYFAMPAGSLRKNEIPQDAGLIVYSPGKDTWKVVKASPRYVAALSQMDWQALLMAKYATERRVRRLKERIIWQENLSIADRIKHLNHEVVHKIIEAEGADHKIKNIKKAVAEGLGINPAHLYQRSSFDLTTFIRQITKRLTVPREKELSAIVMSELATFLCGNSVSYRKTLLINRLQELRTLLETQKED